jgi:hypothetical protein
MVGSCSVSKGQEHEKVKEQVPAKEQEKEEENEKENSPMRPQKLKQGGYSCMGCIQVISYMENWAQVSENEDEIEGILESVCALVEMFEDVCDQIIMAGVPQVVHWIETNQHPADICATLGFCGEQA